ncbi:hypothetical protein ACFSCV_13440 [Methylopila henanensis]|uniref:LTXXQ motif family protein n=1 Tax=Methylopila henanensis TaxID=873516 RepID=A0ABW4KA67_9HYPH
MRKTALAIAFVTASAAATSVFALTAASQAQPAPAQSAQIQPPAPHQAERDGRGERHAHGPRHGHGPMHKARRKGEDFALKLAGRLAAAEVAIGVRGDQLDTWRAFTAAAVDFVKPPRPAGPRPGPDGDERGPDRPRGVLDFADRMADRTIERAEKAKTLKAAAEALRQKLTPEQIAQLDSMPLGPRHGERGRHGPDRHGPGPHGDRHGPR